MTDRKLVTDEEIRQMAGVNREREYVPACAPARADGARWCRDRYEPELAKRDALLRVLEVELERMRLIVPVGDSRRDAFLRYADRIRALLGAAGAGAGAGGDG